MISQETLVDPVSLECQSRVGRVTLNCRSIRVGTLFRLLIEPVIVSTFLSALPPYRIQNYMANGHL